MNFKKLLIAVSLLGLVSTANADTESADYDTIKLISIGSTGNLYIYMTGSELTISGLTCSSSTRYTLAADSPSFKIIYAQVLTAMAANFEVKFALFDGQDGDPGCTENSLTVARAAMRI